MPLVLMFEIPIISVKVKEVSTALAEPFMRDPLFNEIARTAFGAWVR